MTGGGDRGSGNAAPVAGTDTLNVAEGRKRQVAAAALLANDTDVDAPDDTLTVTAVGSAINGTVSLAGQTITFTPDANYAGPA